MRCLGKIAAAMIVGMACLFVGSDMMGYSADVMRTGDRRGLAVVVWRTRGMGDGTSVRPAYIVVAGVGGVWFERRE